MIPMLRVRVSGNARARPAADELECEEEVFCTACSRRNQRRGARTRGGGLRRCAAVVLMSSVV
jgi:hypothetical protein